MTVTRPTGKLWITFKERAYTSSPAQLAELPRLRDFIVSLVGDVTPLEDMADLSRHNRDWLHAVRLEGEDRYVGAYSLLPLNAHATHLIAANQMTGKDLRLEHVTAQGEWPASVYLGSVEAVQCRFARAATVGAVRQKMQDISKDYSKPCYTRPITEEGLRVAERLGFVPVARRSYQLGEMMFVRRPGV